MAGLRGRIFGGYQLVNQIGSGSVAEVYVARPPASGGRDAVVKVIYPEFAQQPGFVPNFRRIVQLSAKLQNHPHILPLLASGEEGGYLYLVTPFVKDGTLRETMHGGKRLGAHDVVPFFQQLCAALSYAHSLGLTHGNVKPSNIFLFEGRHVLLGDFGLLWDVTHLDMHHSGSGTEAVEYLAPEAFQGQTTQESDIYSAGAVLSAALTGRPPFTGATPSVLFAAHTQQPVPSLASADPSLPFAVRALDPVVQRAMAKQPAARYPSAVGLSQAIETTTARALAAQPTPSAVKPNLATMPDPSTPQQPAFGAALATRASALATLDPPFPPLTPHAQPGLIAPGTLSGLATEPPSGDAPARPRPWEAAPTELPHTTRIATPSAILRPNNQTDHVLDAAASAWDASASGPQYLPAIRPPSPTPGSPPGFDAADAPLGDDRFDAGASNRIRDTRRSLPSGPIASQRPDAHSGVLDQVDWGDSRRLPAVRPAGQRMADGYESYEREAISGSVGRANGSHPHPSAPTVSPTQLGLPRLTMAELQGMPHDAWTSGDAQAVGTYDELDEHNWQPAHDDDRFQGHGSQRAGWRDGLDGAGDTPPFSFDDHDGHDADSFANQRIWTVGSRALRPRRRWRKRLLLGVLILLLLDLSVVVLAHPELCPSATCRLLSNTAHAALGQFVPSAAQAQLSVTPGTVSLHVLTGGSATSTVRVENTGSTLMLWQAASSLPWLTVAPARGSLAAHASAQLTVTAQPLGVAPGTYTDNIGIATGNAALHLPVNVVVGAGAALSVAPPSLAFAVCDTSQSIAVKNTGGAPLNYTMTPSQSGALTLSSGSGTLDPGATQQIAVTLTCNAQTGAEYAVILVSNGGSTQVYIHLT